MPAHNVYLCLVQYQKLGYTVVQLVEGLCYKPDIIILAILWLWSQLSLLTEMSTSDISWG